MPESSPQEQIRKQLCHEGLDHIAKFLNGPVMINDLELSDFLSVLKNDWVIRLRNDAREIQFAEATTGDLVETRDSGRTGEFRDPTMSSTPELRAYVFSGSFAIDLILPPNSAFEVVDDAD